ncbi:hypothetical protein N7512_002887 [Penicillium capsulatum]|nr:hypothetical protein N7512_002887 [Penicillium capsulatum]
MDWDHLTTAEGEKVIARLIELAGLLLGDTIVTDVRRHETALVLAPTPGYRQTEATDGREAARHPIIDAALEPLLSRAEAMAQARMDEDAPLPGDHLLEETIECGLRHPLGALGHLSVRDGRGMLLEVAVAREEPETLRLAARVSEGFVDTPRQFPPKIYLRERCLRDPDRLRRFAPGVLPMPLRVAIKPT